MLVLDPDSGLTSAVCPPALDHQAAVALDVAGHVPRACSFSLQALKRLPRQALGPRHLRRLFRVTVQQL